jgi:hypothetical protein
MSSFLSVGYALARTLIANHDFGLPLSQENEVSLFDLELGRAH